jgi:hypothetical protein
VVVPRSSPKATVIGALGAALVMATVPAGSACNGSTAPASARGAGGSGVALGNGGAAAVGGAPGGASGGLRPSCPVERATACVLGTTQCAQHGVQTCIVGSDGCPAWSMSALCGAPRVCERAAGPTCGDVDWAQWPVPNSPVDQGSPNTQTFTDNGDGTVTDNITKLMWQQEADQRSFTLPQAVLFCPTITTGGYHDWRLPSQIELLSLVDYGAPLGTATIDPLLAPSTPTGRFWSATANQASTQYVWGVEFDFGGSISADQMSTSFVRCVR